MKLVITNNSVRPIIIESALRNDAVVLQHTRDTVVYGRVMPHTLNHSIIFRVYDAGVRDTRFSEQFVNIDLRDTTCFEMNIADPVEWGIPDGP